MHGLTAEAAGMPGLRGEYLRGLALCFETMWNLALEMLGKGEPVPYERCVEASIGQAPSQSDPTAKRERVADLLARAGYLRPQPRTPATNCLPPWTPGAERAWYPWP